MSDSSPLPPPPAYVVRIYDEDAKIQELSDLENRTRELENSMIIETFSRSIGERIEVSDMSDTYRRVLLLLIKTKDYANIDAFVNIYVDGNIKHFDTNFSAIENEAAIYWNEEYDTKGVFTYDSEDDVEDGTEEGEEDAEDGEDGAEEGEDGAEEGEDGAEEGEDGAEDGEDGAEEGEDGAEDGEEGAEDGEDGAEEGEDGAEEGEVRADTKAISENIKTERIRNNLYMIEKLEMICYMSIEWTNAVSFGLLKGRMTDTVWAAIKEEYSRNPKSFHYDDGKAIYYENGELIYQNVLNLNGLYNNDGIYRVEY